MQVIYNFGNAIQNKLYKPMDLQDQPTIKSSCSQKCTLIMYDPDAVGKTYLHWIVDDFYGAKNVILTYQGPRPPKGTGPHRYIFALYPELSLFDQKTREIQNIDTLVKNSKPLETFVIKSAYNVVGGKKKQTKKRRFRRKRKTFTARK